MSKPRSLKTLNCFWPACVTSITWKYLQPRHIFHHDFGKQRPPFHMGCTKNLAQPPNSRAVKNENSRALSRVNTSSRLGEKGKYQCGIQSEKVSLRSEIPEWLPSGLAPALMRCNPKIWLNHTQAHETLTFNEHLAHYLVSSMSHSMCFGGHWLFHGPVTLVSGRCTKMNQPCSDSQKNTTPTEQGPAGRAA